MEFKFYLLAEFELHTPQSGKWVRIEIGRKLYRFSDAKSREFARSELSKVYQNVVFTEMEAESF